MATSCVSPLPMLLSLSTAFSSEEDDTASPASSPFIVKNTFIEFIEVMSPDLEVTARRSTSAPPSTRASRHSHCKSELAEILSSGASTSAMDEDEVTSCFGSCDGSSCIESDLSSYQGWSGGATLKLADLVDEPQQQPRAKLSSKAAVYAPSAYRASMPLEPALNLPPEVRLQMAEVMSVVYTVLLQESSVVQHVHSSENTSGWTIVGAINSMQATYAKRVLAAAGDRMLTAAKQTSNVRVVGAEVNPFTPLHGGLGFGVKLAFVPNDAAACWNYIGKGYCARGYACKWQHPCWEATINVQLEITP